MSIKKIIDIKRQLIISLFWSLVALGLVVSGSVHGVGMVMCWLWFMYHLISIYANISKYGREARDSQARFQKSQEEFKKSRERYNNIFNKNSRSYDDLVNEYKKLLEEQYRQQSQSVVKGEMSITDAYKLMKLTYSDTPEDIKKKYRQLAMLWHPDKFATKSKSVQESANRNFQKLNSAYNVIKKHKNIA